MAPTSVSSQIQEQNSKMFSFSLMLFSNAQYSGVRCCCLTSWNVCTVQYVLILILCVPCTVLYCRGLQSQCDARKKRKRPFLCCMQFSVFIFLPACNFFRRKRSRATAPWIIATSIKEPGTARLQELAFDTTCSTSLIRVDVMTSGCSYFLL